MMSVSEAGDTRAQGSRGGAVSELASQCTDGMADPEPMHETRFQAAVKVIQSLPKNGSFQPSNEMMLKFYSFYKQATQGPCNIPRPGFWDPVGRYKWDAWSTLGTMSKEEAMIAYVEEMKKILESMPINEKVEELLQVIGPFYEIVEDKKHARGSGLTSELNSVLTSTPNCKAVNGKAESSDSGAESEDDEDEEDEEEENDHKEEPEVETKHYEKEELILENDSVVEERFGSLPHNGFDTIENNLAIPVNNDSQTKSALNGTNHEDDVQGGQPSLEPMDMPNANMNKDAEEEPLEDISGMHHLTSDSDSEVFCDSMEQFGQEESSDAGLSNHMALSSHLLKVDHSQLMENPIFPENKDGTLMDSGVESMMEAVVEGKGEVKDGGEDGKPSGRGPHKEKVVSDRMENSAPRRGRGSRLQPPSAGAHGWQTGSGGDDGERWGSERGPKSNLNEQIATVLMRLQEDMQNVLQRLHTLETRTASRPRSVSLHSNEKPASYPKRKPSWWPFAMSPGTLAFAFIWPFIAQWLVHAYFQRRRKVNGRD
ncbi:acyl-CoA-binding domain-containing protein 5 isoform X2 [Ambystoma mexicanum]|uniref:acyl-CoA-binding domain-containing protein 5 isoform X2 n=1 Tax=Ambystoma mexicanum TaxID=8296 RepID=UPI0037E7EB50